MANAMIEIIQVGITGTNFELRTRTPARTRGGVAIAAFRPK
jgi:hypothetical protein